MTPREQEVEAQYLREMRSADRMELFGIVLFVLGQVIVMMSVAAAVRML